MTLNDALRKADRQIDDIVEHVLLDAETFVRDLGADDDEVVSWLNRKRGELSEARRQVHEQIRVAHATGFDAVSSRVH